MNRLSLLLPLAVALLVTAPFARAASPDDVLAENAQMKLTRSDWETELSKIPADQRAPFATDPKRVTAMLNNLLTAKTLAAEARKAGLDRDPAIARRIKLELDRLLAALEVERIETAAGAEFDAKRDLQIPRARELYLADKDKYQRPEQVMVSHIAFITRKHGEAGAITLAREARAKIAAGADFATLAKEISEEPGAATTGGKVEWFGIDQMDAGFAKGAFALTKVGELSEPVASGWGIHVIRLEGRRPAGTAPFEDVRDTILAGLRARVVAEARERKLQSIRSDPDLKVDQDAVEGLVQSVNTDLLRPGSAK